MLHKIINIRNINTYLYDDLYHNKNYLIELQLNNKIVKLYKYSDLNKHMIYLSFTKIHEDDYYTYYE